jgi:hypothetical protein
MPPPRTDLPCFRSRRRRVPVRLVVVHLANNCRHDQKHNDGDEDGRGQLDAFVPLPALRVWLVRGCRCLRLRRLGRTTRRLLQRRAASDSNGNRPVSINRCIHPRARGRTRLIHGGVAWRGGTRAVGASEGTQRGGRKLRGHTFCHDHPAATTPYRRRISIVNSRP